MARAPTPRKPPPIPRRKIEILKRIDLSQAHEIDGFEPVPYVPWRLFKERHQFEIGEHVLLIGKTKSGKTTLTVNGILPEYPWVVVLGTKEKDPALYPQLMKHGFVVSSNPLLDARKTPKVVFKSKVRGLTKAVRAQQKEEFERVLSVIYEELLWACYIDELPYLASPKILGLGPEIGTLFLQGSSEKMTVIVSTQEPVNVPREAFGQIEHIFAFVATDEDRIDRIAEIAGQPKRLFRKLLPALGSHEFVYVKFSDDVLVTSRYEA